MQTINHIEHWIYVGLFYGLLGVRAWALFDSLLRKHAAFTAAGKLTKPAWVVLNGFSLGISWLLDGAINFIALALLIVSLIYLTDVRPAVREVSGGGRW